MDLSKCVRMKDLDQAETDKTESGGTQKAPQETYQERMKKDRTSYNSE